MGGNPAVKAAAEEVCRAAELEAEARRHAERHATGRPRWS
jgi:hypothetical protein